MRSASPKPAVVTSTTGSPVRVSSALVATVVPTLTVATLADVRPLAAGTSVAAAGSPARSAQVARVAGLASASIARAASRPGSAAPPLPADGTLRTCSAPAGDTPITSVNVPPRSIQNCQAASGGGADADPWLE